MDQCVYNMKCIHLEKKLLFMFELKRHVFCLIFIMGFGEQKKLKLATMKNRQLYLKSLFFVPHSPQNISPRATPAMPSRRPE